MFLTSSAAQTTLDFIVDDSIASTIFCRRKILSSSSFQTDTCVVGERLTPSWHESWPRFVYVGWWWFELFFLCMMSYLVAWLQLFLFLLFVLFLCYVWFVWFVSSNLCIGLRTLFITSFCLFIACIQGFGPFKNPYLP